MRLAAVETSPADRSAGPPPTPRDLSQKCASLDLFSADAVHRQLDRIVTSDEFRHSRRLCAFLQFVVGEALAGRGATLKELVIAHEVFERSDDFDPRDNAVVRVEAGRLRSRLQKFYRTTGLGDEIVVDLPKGTYVPVFRRTDDQPSASRHEAPAEALPVPSREQPTRRIGAILACLLRQAPENLSDRPDGSMPPDTGPSALAAVMGSIIPEFGGRIAASGDDAIFAEFQSADEAVGAAFAIQASVEDIATPMGAHTGAMAAIGIDIGTVHGDGVNLHGSAVAEAEHLTRLPDPATIAVSGSVYESLGAQESSRFHFLGSQLAADGRRRYRAYAVLPQAGDEGIAGMPPSEPVEALAASHSHDAGAISGGSSVPAWRQTLAWLPPMKDRGTVRTPILPLAALVVSVFAVAFSIDAVRHPLTRAFAMTFSSSAGSSIAVFPLQEIGTPLASDAISESLTAEIVAELTGVEGLAVRSHAASQAYRGQMVDIQTFGDAMDVGHVLQGHVMKDGQLLHVMVELIDVTTGTNRWAKSIDIPLTAKSDVMKVQKAAANEIRRNVVNVLKQ